MSRKVLSLSKLSIVRIFSSQKEFVVPIMIKKIFMLNIRSIVIKMQGSLIRIYHKFLYNNNKLMINNYIYM